MKAILEFNLPDDKTDHIIAVHAMDWALVCWDIDQELRSIAKHGREGFDGDTADKIRDLLREALEGYGVNLDMLT